MQDIINFLLQHAYLSTAIIAIFFLVSLLELWRAKGNASQLSPPAAIQLINHQDATIIDTRNNEQYRKGHIIAAHNIPATELTQASKKLTKFKNKPLIIVCNTGLEAQKTASRLQKEGYNAYSLTGGMRAWLAAPLPIVKE